MEPVAPLWNISGYFRPGLLALRSSTIRIFRMLKLFRISGAPPSAGRSTDFLQQNGVACVEKWTKSARKKTYKSPIAKSAANLEIGGEKILAVYMRNSFAFSADFGAPCCTKGDRCKAEMSASYRSFGPYWNR